MSSSIFNIQNWANSTDYLKNDIVSDGSFYFYCLKPHTSHASQSFSQTREDNPDLWGGVTLDNITGESKPHFIWTPSYQTNTNITPLIKSIKFGDGYEQRVRDGINNILLEIEIKLENRSSQEITAIAHFLYEKAGYKSFLFTPSPPYNTLKRFVARSWSQISNFYDNHSINVKFEEVSN